MRLAVVCVMSLLPACGSKTGLLVDVTSSDAGTPEVDAGPQFDAGMAFDAGMPPRFATQITAAGGHTCAWFDSDRSAWCWGTNMSGELTGDVFMAFEPLRMESFGPARSILTGGGMVLGGSTCIVTEVGRVSCTGRITETRTPVGIPGLDSVVQLAIADLFACALLEDRTVACWGENELGQLGTDTLGSRSDIPLPVIGLADVTAVTVGESGEPDRIGAVSGGHACALLRDSRAFCWGAGGGGQLGDGRAIRSTVPVQVVGLGPIASIRAGGESVGGDKGHTCAALLDGTAACWGNGWAGQLGDGGAMASPIPVPVRDLTDVVDVAAGGVHNCALRRDGTVWCWGSNGHRQLGDGTTVSSAVPVQVRGLADVVSLEAGVYHNCALLGDGSLRCWGIDQMGQLGDGPASAMSIVEPAFP